MKTLFVILLLLISMRVFAPSAKVLFIEASERVNPFENIWNAVCLVESSGNPNAIGDKHLKEWSYGIAQIRRSRLDDYYNQTGVRIDVIDMLDPEKSKQVFMFYCSAFNPWQVENIARSWNGGPRWRSKESTKNYYFKIQNIMRNVCVLQ